MTYALVAYDHSPHLVDEYARDDPEDSRDDEENLVHKSVVIPLGALDMMGDERMKKNGSEIQRTV
jgi:hypothetical protein